MNSNTLLKKVTVLLTFAGNQMKKRTMICLFAIWPGILFGMAESPHLLYSESFEYGSEMGPVGRARGTETNAGGRPVDFTIDARGHIDMDRGTFAFFTKCEKDPESAVDHSLGGIDQQVEEGHYFQVMGFERWRTDFLMLFLDAGRYAPPLRLPPVIGRWKAGEWHHLAVVWDRNDGITVYEDGRRVASNMGTYRWGFSLPPRNIFLKGAVDELRIYADCLTDQQVAALADGKDPTGPPLSTTPVAERRKHDLARMGWSGDSRLSLPVVESGQPQQFTFAKITGCSDAKWRTGVPFDGMSHTTWPQIYYGPGIKGETLEIKLAPNSRYDRVRALIQRPFRGQLCIAGEKNAVLKLDIPEAAIWHRHLGGSFSGEQLELLRDFGQLGELDFYRVEPVTGNSIPKDRLDYHFSPADTFPDSELGRFLQSETPVRFQRPVSAGIGPAPAPWTIDAPAFGGFQAFTTPPLEAKAFDGAIVTLVAENITEPTPVRIVIKEPVHSQRDWLVADAILTPHGNGKQIFTLILTGRPVINMPPIQLLPIPQRGNQPAKPATQQPGVAFGVTVTAANSVKWAMGSGGCSVGFLCADKEKALPLAVEDQIEFMRQGFSTLMEGGADSTDPRIQVPLQWLSLFAPERREVKQVLRRSGVLSPFQSYTPPASEGVPLLDPGRAPEWAFWQREAMNKLFDMVSWRIENTQLDTGEYGATFNDDTDYVECWIDYALCLDDDRHTIKNSLRRFWDGLWRYSLDGGVGRYYTDSGHYAEEGLMSTSMRMLVDYGDPVACERVLETAAHVDNWVVKTEKGYRFPSDWVGKDGIWSEGDWKQPGYSHRSDLLIPDGYLLWYCQHPSSARKITGVLNEEMPDWNQRPPENGVAAKGFIDWAGASLRDPDELRHQCASALIAGKVISNRKVVYTDDRPQWVAVAGIPPQWKYEKPIFRAMPPIPAYVAWKHTEAQWFDWKLSGDIRFLVDAYRRTVEWFNNYDYVITEAMPSADRIAEPRDAVICSRMGARAANRGASGLPWPLHAISYERGAKEIAALVTENLTDRLTVRFYSFSDKPHTLDSRVWRLWPGTYKLKLSRDKNDDGRPEEILDEREIQITRGTPFQIILPSQECAILSLEPVKISKPELLRPDPAISLDTVDVVYNRHLVVKVHNLGAKPAENVLVRVRDSASGRIIPMGEQRIPKIDAPMDFKPSYRIVQFDQIYAIARGVIIEVDPDGETGDLNPYNNKVELDESQIFGRSPLGSRRQSAGFQGSQHE